MSELLFLAGVHGDEQDAPEILNDLKVKGILNRKFLIANPKALKKNKRFIDADMNRVAPGSINSKKYEKRRVAKVLEKAKKFKFVIDLHGSKGNQGVFTIVPNPNLQSLILATILPVRRIIIWPYNKKTKEGPIMKFINCGVGIEFGPKGTPAIKKSLSKIIREIDASEFKIDPQKIKDKEFYFIYERVRKAENLSKFQDFTLARVGTEDFYPIFIGAYKSIAFYKAKKINFEELLEKCKDA